MITGKQSKPHVAASSLSTGKFSDNCDRIEKGINLEQNVISELCVPKNCLNEGYKINFKYPKKMIFWAHYGQTLRRYIGTRTTLHPYLIPITIFLKCQ